MMRKCKAAFVMTAAWMLLFLLVGGCVQKTPSQQEETINTVIEITTAVPETTVAETTVAETTVSEEELAAQAAADEAQRKLDVVSRFTIDYEGDDLTFYLGNTFLDLYISAGMHWNPQPLLRDWEDYFPVYDLTMEYDDPVYGIVELSCRGAEIHEILMTDTHTMYYDNCFFKEKDGTEHYHKRKKIEAQTLYIIGSCEGEYFGMPEDGGTGPFWIVEMGEDGKVRPLWQNIVMLKPTLPNSLLLPGAM